MYNAKQCVSIADRRTQVNNRKYVLWQQGLKQEHSADNLVGPCLSSEYCRCAAVLRYTSPERGPVRAVTVMETETPTPPIPKPEVYISAILTTDNSYWYVLVIMDYGKFVIHGTHAQMCVRRNKCVMLVYV
jgi:hypothetical protein